MVTQDFLNSQEYATKRAAINREINRNTYKPSTVSAERWQKTKSERTQLAEYKTNVLTDLLTAGLNPKRRMNVSAPIHIVLW